MKSKLEIWAESQKIKQGAARKGMSESEYRKHLQKMENREAMTIAWVKVIGFIIILALGLLATYWSIKFEYTIAKEVILGN